jgi:cellulose synthase (UDP-forming)
MMSGTSDFHESVQSEHVFKLRDYVSFTLLTVVSYAAIIYFMVRWFSYDDWYNRPIAFWGLTLIIIGRLAIHQFRWWHLPFMKQPVSMAARPGWKVGVATTFVPGAEPIEMLEETVRALVALDYPHDTWVLDEGDDAQVASLCAELGALYFTRKNRPHYQTADGPFRAQSKHGNYNAWFHEVGFGRYDIIVTFDPDHVPETTYLSEVLGYFNDPQIGYVQPAQVYYNQDASFIARGAAEETYGYYSSTQMFAFAMGYPIVTGCHNAHRVTALKQVGGLPAHDAEDLLLTMLYRSNGWRGVYLPKILARGLTPVDWSSYIKQQLRWARSVLDIKLRHYPKIAGKLPLKERVTSFLHGLYYFQPTTVMMGLLLMAYMLATGVVPSALNYIVIRDFCFLLVVLVLCDFYRQRFYLDRSNEWGWHWRAGVLQVAKWPYFLSALWQVLLNRRSTYVLTPKVKDPSRPQVVLWPHLLVAALICTAWMFGVISGRNLKPLLHVSAAVTVIGILLLLATEHMGFPEPYNPNLRLSLRNRRKV